MSRGEGKNRTLIILMDDEIKWALIVPFIVFVGKLILSTFITLLLLNILQVQIYRKADLAHFDCQ